MFYVESAKIEWDEDGASLILTEESGVTRAHKLLDPEQVYDAVKGGIGPWLRERDEARHTFRCDPDESGGYASDDPKSPHFYSTHADIHDMRERNPDEYEYLRTEVKREAAGE